MARNLNGAPITAREADAIEAALLASPGDFAGIAARFSRSPGTIRRVAWARRPASDPHEKCGHALADSSGEGA